MRRSLQMAAAAFLFLLAACSADNQTKLEATPVMITAAEQTGAPTFEAPEGWSRADSADVITFTAPEGDAKLVLVRVPNAADAEAAASIAWTNFNPDFDRAVKLNIEEGPGNGWDAIREIEYVTSPAEERLLYAYPHVHDGQWYVFLLDGHTGTINKRGASTRGMLQSLTRAGFSSEDLSGRTVKMMTPDKVQSLLDFVETSAAALSVPGVGIGLIQNGEVIFSGGVGVKNVDSGAPIDGDTRFIIASNTKGMTTLLLAKLVEMGTIGWDDPVIDHYPDFRLGDDDTTKSVLIRHLVCACTGLPRKDFEWVFNNGPDTPVAVIFEELAATTPTSDFGELYQYNNQMAAAAGYVAAHLIYPDMEIGAAYDRAMQEFIFGPLHMDNTTFDFKTAVNGNIAAPYGVDFDGAIVSISQTETSGFNHTMSASRPAGAAWSTTTDMLKYIQNELTAGVSPDGTRLFAKAPLLERRNPTVETGATSSYGMGLSNRDISGIAIVEHGGSMGGYKSQIVIIPEANVGAVILTNSDEGRNLTFAFSRKLVELLYDAEPKAAAEVTTFSANTKAHLAKERAALTIPADPKVVAGLASRYSNPELGVVDIRHDGPSVILDTGVWSAPLGTKTNEDGTVSLMVIEGAARGVIELIIGEAGGKRTLSLITPQHSYVLTEVE